MFSTLYNLIKISISAGRKILEIYDSDISFITKSDNSPLTLADKESNRIIMEGLKKYYPDMPVMSEEGKEISYEIRKDWDYYFLVDPLDGTKEFIKRNGEFTVNIALIEKDTPVLGVIFIPVLKKIYYALKGCGSYKLSLDATDDKDFTMEEIKRFSIKLPISRDDKSEKIAIAGSRSHLRRWMFLLNRLRKNTMMYNLFQLVVL